MQTKEILTDQQYKILSIKLIDAIERRYKVIPLNTLKHLHYSLKDLYILRLR
jgi:hypothetical protein